MRRTTLWQKTCLWMGILGCTAGTAAAADINLIAAPALRPALQTIVPEFQKATGHTVLISYAGVGAIQARVRKGEPYDVSVTTPEQWEALRNEGKVDPNVRVRFAKVGIGIAVKKGEQKPDVRTRDALKQTLLDVKTVAIADPASGSPAGAGALQLFEQLGVAAAMKDKIKTAATTEAVNDTVAKGAADLGINEVNLITIARAVELAGPLPEELQRYSVFVAGVPQTTKDPAAAQALANHLKSPSAAEAFKANALEPAE